MKKKSKRTLTPKLRFPEFRGEPGWEVKELEDIVTSISNGISLAQGAATSGVKVTRIETISESRIDLSKVGYIETDEDISAHKLSVGDILLSNINSVAHIGKSVIIDRDYELYHGMNLLRLVIDSQRVVPQFAFLSLNTEEARASIRERANKAVNQASINQTELGRTLVVVPHLAEQQKIAECLSSLDELIAAEGRKLEALKAHKKGLMQQLFPQPGQTQPRLRFPEFRNAGDWTPKKLGQAATFFNGRAYRKDELLDEGKYKVLRVGNFFTNDQWYFSDLELDETKYCEKGDLLYAWSASFGPRIWHGERVIYHYHIWKVVEGKDINKRFLFVCLDRETERMKSQSANGLGLLHITKGTIEDWDCVFPEIDEQIRIAACLSSLDTRITAQAAKIETLKQHKRGLMQQLFPALEEV